MSKNLEAFKFNQNPAKSPSQNHFWEVHNNISGNVKKITNPLSNYQKKERNTSSVFEIAPSSFLNGGKIKKNPSPLKIAYQKKIDKVAQNTANFGKRNFISPYPNAQINSLETLLGKWIETDYETAKTGGLIIPKILRNFVIMSYLGTWLDTTLMPTGIPDAVWKLKKNIIVPPLLRISRGISNSYQKTKKILGFKSKQPGGSNLYKKTTTKISALRNWVNKKLTFSLFDKKKKNQLAEKNEEFYENLKDAA